MYEISTIIPDEEYVIFNHTEKQRYIFLCKCGCIHQARLIVKALMFYDKNKEEDICLVKNK